MSMRIGSETGSLCNHLLSGTVGEPTPKVGMGATILMWTDRHAATIVKVTPTQIHVRRDKATRVDKNGLSECQEYIYEEDSAADVEIFRKTKRGWRRSGVALRIGDRREYHDFSF